MTTTEFKKLKPEYKDVEGDQLWNAMENYMLRQQQGSEVLKAIMPIWKTHTFRWLFYRKSPNFVMGNPKTDKWVSPNRCKNCKKGVNARLVWSTKRDDGTWGSISYCPHCNKEYKEEPNTNLSHKLWRLYKGTINLFWMILDKIHLVRTGERYGMMGDESRYVENWSMNMETYTTTPNLKTRKWWEYIIVEKPIHNF